VRGQNHKQEKGNKMKVSQFRDYSELPLFLNAELVAKVLGVSPSSGFELMREPGFPVLKIGSRMVVPKEKFIQWVEQNSGGGVN
jgi:predicted DNA-binding transcriptional regulator AlpA